MKKEIRTENSDSDFFEKSRKLTTQNSMEFPNPKEQIEVQNQVKEEYEHLDILEPDAQPLENYDLTRDMRGRIYLEFTYTCTAKFKIISIPFKNHICV